MVGVGVMFLLLCEDVGFAAVLIDVASVYFVLQPTVYLPQTNRPRVFVTGP